MRHVRKIFTAVNLRDFVCTRTCELFVACVVNLCKKRPRCLDVCKFRSNVCVFQRLFILQYNCHMKLIVTPSVPVIFFVTGLHGLTQKLGILLMNVSLSTSCFEGEMY